MDELPLAWANVDASSIITPEPAYLLLVVVTSDDTDAAADATVYSGTTSGGRKVGKFKAVRYESKPINFPYPGLPCPHGIYIEEGSNVDNMLVVYRSAGNDL